MSSFDPTAMWDTSCLDWEQRLRDGRSLVPDLPLFTDQAERGLRIFKRLKVPDMIGNPVWVRSVRLGFLISYRQYSGASTLKKT